MSRASWASDFDGIARRAGPRVDNAAREAAHRIKATARTLVVVGAPQVHIRDTIRVNKGRGPWVSYEVLAGSRRVFYGHLIERGSVNAGPRPFMTPAAEMERATGKLRRDVKDAFND